MTPPWLNQWGGTRPIGWHSTGHPHGGTSSTGKSLDTAPTPVQSPARNPNRKQHSIPGHSTSRRADWHTAPTPIPRIRGPRTCGLVARRSARNPQLEAPNPPHSGGPAKQRGVAVDGGRSPRSPPNAAPAPVPGHSFLATAACRGRGASFPLRSHFEVRGRGGTWLQNQMLRLSAHARIDGHGRHGDGCNNNDEVTANRPQRVKM